MIGPSATITFEITILDGAQKDETAVVTLLPDDAGGDVSKMLSTWTKTKNVKQKDPSFEVSFTTKDQAGLSGAAAEGLEPVLFSVNFQGSSQTIECGFVIKNR